MSNLTIKQKEIGLIILSSLFCLTVIAYAYFNFYSPKKDSLLVAESTYESDSQVLYALEQQLENQPEPLTVSSFEFQKKVPVDPLTNLVILQIEKAEVVSKSLVQSVSFSEGPFVIENPPEGVEALQELLVSLSIETPTYATLETFINEIEQLDRIFVVESIAFSSNGEVTTAEKEQTNLQLTLTFSAFYRPDLIELLEEGPKVDTPPPADKVNPLPANGGVDDEVVVTIENDTDTVAISENNSTETAAINVAQTAVPKSVTKVVAKTPSKAKSKRKYHTYSVKPGDTLFSISMKYYGSRAGESKIKRANRMKSDQLVAYSKLIIPK